MKTKFIPQQGSHFSPIKAKSAPFNMADLFPRTGLGPGKLKDQKRGKAPSSKKPAP